MINLSKVKGKNRLNWPTHTHSKWRSGYANTDTHVHRTYSKRGYKEQVLGSKKNTIKNREKVNVKRTRPKTIWQIERTNKRSNDVTHTHTHTHYKIQNTHTPRPGHNWNLNHSNNVSKVQCWYYPVVNGVNYVFVPFNVFSTKLIFDFHCWCRLQSDWIGFRIIHITFNDIPSDCLLFLFALDIVYVYVSVGCVTECSLCIYVANGKQNNGIFSSLSCSHSSY